MDACAPSHHWAHVLTKLGHEVRLMPAKDLKAYVKRADAEAICETVRCPTMRFVRIKSAEQQGQLMLHRARDLLMRQCTQLINALRAHLTEFGIAAAQGRDGIKKLLAIVAQDEGSRLPVDAYASLPVLAAQPQAVQTMIGSLEKRIVAQHRSNEASKRLETILGIGIIGATRSQWSSRIGGFFDRAVILRRSVGVGKKRISASWAMSGPTPRSATRFSMLPGSVFASCRCGLSSLRSKLSAFSIVSRGRLSFTVKSSNTS
jgi:transposase